MAVVLSVFVLVGAVIWLGLSAQQTGAVQASVPAAASAQPAAAPQASPARAVTGGALAAPAAGTRARPADRATWLAVTRAVINSPDTSEVPDHAYAVVDIRVARSDRSWAMATLEPRDLSVVDEATVILHLDGRTWRVKDLGSFDVGCGIVPRSVLRDFGLACSPQ